MTSRNAVGHSKEKLPTMFESIFPKTLKTDRNSHSFVKKCREKII